MRALASVFALALLLSSATASAQPTPAPFDPLALDIPGFLAPAGVLARVPPAPGSTDFPANAPNAPGPPLSFSFPAPIRFAPSSFVVKLRLTEAKPFVTQNADKESLRVSLLVDGRAAPGATQSVPFAQPVATPGAVEDVTVTLVAPGLVIAKGANVTLQLQALASVLPEGALSVALGPSTASFPAARVPSLDDLELQDAPLAEFLLANGSFVSAERNAATYIVHVRHSGVDIESKRDPSQTVSKIYVVLRGEEDGSAANAHAFPDRERRVAAAHAFLVDGQLVRAYPGVGVVAALDWNHRNLTVPLRCAQNCPPGEFAQNLSFAAITAPGAAGSDASTLIPPPRDTNGIAGSQDAPPEKKLVPAPWVPWTLGALSALVLSRRR